MTESHEETSTEKKERPRDQTYVIRGIPGRVYLDETGEFRWVPACEACADKEGAESILEVLEKIPPDRRAVWVQRLDLEQAKNACPIIRSDNDLCRAFDDFCAAYSKPETKPEQKKATEVKRP